MVGLTIRIWKIGVVLLFSSVVYGADSKNNKIDNSQGNQYQGSQAFNLNPSSIESVNPHTGTLGITKPLISQAGVNNSLNLNFNLIYSPGTSGVLGLPQNWGFNINYVTFADNIPVSLIYQGRNYIIDPTWQDETNYQSGLRYINNHGLKFDIFPNEPPLPSKKGTYKYRLTAGDGSHDYFDATGKLVERDDRFGNLMSFHYNDPSNGVPNNLLSQITDSYGQVFSFNYLDNALEINFPKGAKTSGTKITLNYTSNGIANITDSFNSQTTFQYDPDDLSGKIISIMYPTGLSSVIKYTDNTGGILYYDSSGNLKRFSAVSTLSHSGINGHLLESRQYQYGNEISSFFTGYPNIRFSNISDSLMDSNDVDFQYEVLVARMDATGNNYLAKQRTYYNYLHLPVISKHYLNDSDWYQTEYTYAPQGSNPHARNTNYNKPILIETSLFVEKKQVVKLKKWQVVDPQKLSAGPSSKGYNDYGNLLAEQSFLFDHSINTNAYVLQYQKINSFQTVTWSQPPGTMPLQRTMPRSKTVLDLITGYEGQINYSLTDDNKSIKSKALQYQTTRDQSRASQNWNPWKTINCTYDDQGRLTSKKLMWSPGTQPDPDSILSTNYQVAYALQKSILTVTRTDAFGYKSTMNYDLSIPGSPLIEDTSPLGQTIKREYDSLGRLAKTTDAMGNVYTQDYTFAVSGKVNSVISTGPTGYKKATYFDELGRPIKATDNGDPTNTTQDRVLKTTTYNAAGQVAQTTDILGLVTAFEYDLLGRPINTSDPLGNVATTTYDDKNFSITSSLNKQPTGKTTKDGYGRTILKESYPDPDDTSISYFIRQETQYNGFGQITRTTKSKVAGQTVTPLTQINTLSFDADGKAVSRQLIGYNNAQAQEQAQTTNIYDLLGRPLHSSKKVTYADGRTFQVTSDKTKYVQKPQENSVSVTNAAGQVEVNTFDANGQLHTHTRYDGTTFTYAYDANGNLDTIKWTEGGKELTIKHEYNADNSLKKVYDASGAINYEYYLDGKMKSVSYPHSTQQQYIRDQYSRVLTQTDPSGAQTSYIYNPKDVPQDKGLLKTVQHVQQGTESLTYTYGTVNHQNGVVTNVQLSGQKAWTYSYDYSGWGQLNSAEVSNTQNTTATASTSTANPTKTKIVTVSRHYDELGRIKTAKKSSEVSPDKNMNLSKTYTYDGFSQLSTSATTYTDSSPPVLDAYTYDGNNNVLTHTVGGQTQNYQYNNLDQLVGQGIEYDSNGRMTKDDQGNTYVYNKQDELIKVVSPSGATLVSYTYYPDGLLASRSDKAQSQDFFYNGGTVNAVSSSASGNSTSSSSTASSSTSGSNNQAWTSFLFNGQQRLGAYEQNQQAVYYVTANGSTGATVTGETTNGLDYQPYGSPQTHTQSSTSLPADKSFTWNQEYVDPATGLVYLRTRHYNPQLRRFMSRDTMPLYNRYAFGNGDPINMIDPTGQWSLDSIFSTLISCTEVVAGIALDVIPGGEVAGGALIGAGVNGITYSVTHQNNFRWGAWGIQEGIGAAVGAVTAGFGAVAGAVMEGASVAARVAVGTVVGAGVGAGTNVAAQAATNAASNQNVSSGLGQAAIMGAVMGGAGEGLGGLIGGAREAPSVYEDPSELGMEIEMDVKPKSLCFAGGTLISTDQGKKPIEEIKVGDKVWAYDILKNEETLQEVIKLFKNTTSKIVEIKVGQELILTTPEHPFYVNKEWIEAQLLKAGHNLYQRNKKELAIASIKHKNEELTVYNFEVSVLHNYYVSGLEVLVHNPNCGRFVARNTENTLSGPMSDNRPLRGTNMLPQSIHISNQELILQDIAGQKYYEFNGGTEHWSIPTNPLQIDAIHYTNRWTDESGQVRERRIFFNRTNDWYPEPRGEFSLAEITFFRLESENVLSQLGIF